MSKPKPADSYPMPGGPRTQPPQPPVDHTGQMFTAALLQAAQGGCDCPVCRLLRQISQKLTSDLLQGVK